eukprot:9684007-Lingulodinium_polyedra.AAC.1
MVQTKEAETNPFDFERVVKMWRQYPPAVHGGCEERGPRHCNAGRSRPTSHDDVSTIMANARGETNLT